MQNFLKKYRKELDPVSIKQEIEIIKKDINQYYNIFYLKRIFSTIDLTSLNYDDNEENILNICFKINNFSDNFPDMPGVAAVCVFPSLVHVAKKNLNIPGTKIVSVAGGFPSSQTFLEVKIEEAELAVEAGADEIDIVMPSGSFLAGEHKKILEEITAIKRAIGRSHLKVILETGLLKTPQNIRNASMLAMFAGADFIKTSTGKINPAATHDSVYIMADAAVDFYRESGKLTGIKPAGGIIEPEEAVIYSAIIGKILGPSWITPELYRIGASRLSNNLLTAIKRLEMGDGTIIKYF